MIRPIELILLVGMIIAAYVDYKTREIPLWDFPSVAVIFTIFHFLKIDHITTYNIVGLLVMFGLFFILCAIDKIGGGDMIMFSVMGYILGIFNMSLYSICLFVVVCPYMIFLYIKGHNIKEEKAVAPVACIAYVLYLIMEVILYVRIRGLG